MVVKSSAAMCSAFTLAVCLAASAALAQPARHHVPALAGPECLTPSAALSNALSHGATAGRLDGAEASALLSKINETPPQTDFHASTVVVVLRPGEAVIALFGVCHEHDVTLRLDAFAEVWRAARGEGA